MSKFESVPLKQTQNLRRIVRREGVKCSFCCSTNVNRETLTCKDCGTTAPMNYGATQRRTKHGEDIPGLK